MLRHFSIVIRIAFTYIGTIVGAGFATGQEILQFFTRYGSMAAFTILLAAILFIWIGVKMMVMAYEMKAKSYEDLNRMLFGPRIGSIVSLFMMIILFGISTVMLAGAGSVFSEQLHLSYQTGLLLTLFLSYLVISRGIGAIMTVNTVIVPLMILFSVLIVWHTISSPNAGNWLFLTSDYSFKQIWLAPLLYAAFNLSTAQAVLVPLGAAAPNKSVLYLGAGIGGGIIGLLLIGAHIALSTQMPGITQFEIPMAGLVTKLGYTVQFIYILVIYCEIFTTYIADIYGLTLQLEQRSKINSQFILVILLILSYVVSQIGFKVLLSSLYPAFGLISMVWLGFMVWRRRAL
ncbi:YkvI family membrane protein [Paenibacillus sp. KN14-4R]|uniref:YkvI family membrane protein n=1 Tax=Paenibacillus sp. KN14-4R TaxID=3445773 RepID=UPI003F9EF209